MKAVPVAMAIGCIQNGTIAGKLNGVIPATTPRGWRTVWASTPVETFSEKPPLRSWVMEVANSRVSRPRAISPLASPMVLPCSREIATAISSVASITSWRMRNRIWVRRASDTFAHSRWARAAERTARSTVSASPRCRVPAPAPAAGVVLGCVGPAGARPVELRGGLDHQLAHAEQDLGAAGQRPLRPLALGPGRRAHRLIDGVGIAQVQGADLGAGGGVHDRLRGAGGGDVLAAD